ncbi:MAG: 7-cyano-7-deazaguanine synthase [Planctomycetia bacterium]|nr:7-cyano-7-deazaguanine synthase [Planctomycetia bacterium]
MQEPSAAVAVLISGGLDSAILLGEMLREQPSVQPLYVRNGLYWEAVELEHLRRFLAVLARPALRPLHVLDLPVADLYGQHWSITGDAVPDAGTPDEAVFLPGRNVLLLAKSLLWCHLHGVPRLVLGVLGSNPFPDATDDFFAEYQRAVNRAVEGRVEVKRPFAGLHKIEVMQRGRDLPLELSFSCIRPFAGRHCGRCNKCAERRQAFADAGLADPTPYGEAPCIA